MLEGDVVDLKKASKDGLPLCVDVYYKEKVSGECSMISQALPLPYNMHHLSLSGPTNDKNNIKFVNPNADNFERNIRHTASLGLPMAEKDQHKGAGAIIVGSGPSLKNPEVIGTIRRRQDDGFLIFACKAAIAYLWEKGILADYGVSMDPGAHIASPNKIKKVTGVKHIIASSSDPMLFEYLMGEEEGYPAEVIIFHSACGLPVEIKLYKELFPDDWVATGGFNVVNRAMSLALHMGCDRIVLAGTDCGWREDEQMYVDGPAHRPGVDMCDNGVVDGIPWMTRPDMLASGVALARQAQKMGDRMEILGDVLPQSLRGKDDAFLKLCADFK